MNPILKSGAMIAFFGLLSRLAGLYRDRVLASKFGPSEILDAYYVSFGLPDLIFNLLIVGALASAFIPVFIEYESKNKANAFRLANNFLNLAFTAVTIFGLIVFIFSDYLVDIIAPGFSDSQKDLTSLFLRIMIISPMIFSLSVIMGAILQSFKKFISYSLAPILYNLGIIIGAVYLVPILGPSGLAWGVVLGALMHFLIQFIEVRRLGFKWQPGFGFKDPGIKKIIKLMIPRSMGLAASHVNWLVLNALATTVFIGGASILNLAHNLHYFPVAIVGISLAVASFPDLSRDALNNRGSVIMDKVEEIIKVSLFIIIPLAALMFYFSNEIITIILSSGFFSGDDIGVTANVLKIFAIGVIGNGLVPILARVFYAFQNTRTPLVASLISLVVSVIISFSLISKIGIYALPLSFSVGISINAILLVFLIKSELKAISPIGIINYSLLLGTIAIAMLGSIFLISEKIYLGDGLVYQSIRLASLSAFGVAVYAVLAYLLGVKEIKHFI